MVILSVYVCVSLHLSAICDFCYTFCIMSHSTCFFVVVVHFSLVTPLYCFISLGTLLATFLWLYRVFMGVFTSLQFLIFVRLSASCHIVTCFFVDVVDFSLVTTLFVLFH